MSDSIEPSNYGLLSALMYHAGQVRQQLDNLTEEVSTGYVANNYGGLGSAAAVPLSLDPEISALTTYQNNISRASGIQQVTQAAMTQIQQIASSFYSQVQSLNSLDGSEIGSLAGTARSALQQLAGLLDTQDGGVYVFGGADTGNPPVPDPGNILSSSFYAQIASDVSSLGPNTPAQTLSDARNPAYSPFSGYLTGTSAATLRAEAPVVQTGPNQTQSVGLLANVNTAAISTGGSTTGSYTVDLMRALATIGSMTSADAVNPNFSTLVEDTASSLQGAIGAMADDAGILGNRQTALTDVQSDMSDTQSALQAQVGSVQDANVAQVMSQISLVQTQLQASYQLIGGLSGITLAKLLPVS